MSVSIPTLVRCAIITSVLACLTGCTSTGGKVAKTAGASNVRNLGVTVQVRKDLEVLNATEDSAFLGAFLLGVLGDEIQQGARRSRDNRTAEPMRRQMSPDTYRARAQAKLGEALRHSGKFESVQVAEASARTTGCDAVLTVDVEQWGVRPSPVAKGKNKPMEVGHMVSYKLVSQGTQAVLWHRRELFLSGVERTLTEYQNNPATLVHDLESSLDRYCGLIANQLIY